MRTRSNTGNIIRLTTWIVLGFSIAAYVFVSSTVAPGQAVMVRDLFYCPIGALTVALMILTAIRFRGQDGRVWTWFSVTAVGWMLGDLLAVFMEVTGEVGVPRLLGPPDVFYLTAYAGFVMGVMALARLIAERESRPKWVRWYPAGLAIGVALMTAAFAILMPRGLTPAGPGEAAALSMIIDYFYPALDIALLFGLLFTLLSSKLPWAKPWQELMVGGLTLFLIADITYSFSAPAGVYDPANLPSQLVVVLWITAYSAAALAAVYKLTDPEIQPVSVVPYFDSETEA